MGGEKTHESCSGCDQGFGHLYVAICIDAIAQFTREEFWECVTTGEEHLLQNIPDQVVPVNEVGVCRGGLPNWSHLLILNEVCRELTGSPG